MGIFFFFAAKQFLIFSLPVSHRRLAKEKRKRQREFAKEKAKRKKMQQH